MNIIVPSFTINNIPYSLKSPNHSMNRKNYTILERKFGNKVLILFTQSI